MLVSLRDVRDVEHIRLPKSRFSMAFRGSSAIFDADFDYGTASYCGLCRIWGVNYCCGFLSVERETAADLFCVVLRILSDFDTACFPCGHRHVFIFYLLLFSYISY